MSEWWSAYKKPLNDPGTAYSNYVSSVQSALGSSTVGDNCVYLGNWSFDTSSLTSTEQNYVTGITFQSGSLFSYTGDLISRNDITDWNTTSTLVAPVSGTYTFTFYWSSNDSTICYLYPVILQQNGTNLYGPNFIASDNGSVTFSYDLSAGSIYSLSVVAQAPSFKSGHFVISGACRMEYPTGGLATAAGSTDVSTETRTGSLCGDYFYEGDNGTMVQAENIYLFDETNNTVNNPQTGTTATASSWTYDYATRTYTIITTDGSTYKITYGDDKATQTKTDTAGTTITYNYYYGSSSGSGGTDDNGTSWWEKILNKLSDGILAIFDLVGTIIGSIIGGLADLVTSTVSSLKSLVESMGQLPRAIGSLYTWMPAELQAVISAAFTVVVFAGLIKFFM